MSWWVYAPGDESDGINVTYNLAGMFAAALDLPERLEERSTVFGLRLLDGAPGSEAGGVLRRAVERMEADPDKYRAMNPPNGWGDYEGALACLRYLHAGCVEHPDGIVAVH